MQHASETVGTCENLLLEELKELKLIKNMFELTV